MSTLIFLAILVAIAVVKVPATLLSADCGSVPLGDDSKLARLRSRRRRQLPVAVRQHLEVAERLLEAGNIEAAADHLKMIAPEHRLAQPALKLRFKICAAKREWQECREIASLMANLGGVERIKMILDAGLEP